ncbi:MAG: cyclic nucleotide-binding/CBS domain-containing protein, partial [Candidatus Hydrothermarchaeales archaeon]
ITVVNSTTTVSDVTKLMAKKDIGSVLVRKSGDIIGILTERDILKKAIANGLDVKHTPVSEIMVMHPYVIDSEATVHDASHALSKHRIRRLPVVEGGKIIGMVTSRDVAQSLRYSFFKKRHHHTTRGIEGAKR